jgi:hypothetical protein
MLLRDNAMTDLAAYTFSSRSRIIAYWVTTALVVSELAWGGVWDILRVPRFAASSNGWGILYIS